MLTVNNLIRFALGDEQWRKVDLAIPQPIHDGLTQTAREDVAGWYYDEQHRIGGRLLTKTECWKEIEHKLKEHILRATMFDANVSYILLDWPCWRYHVEHGHVVLEVV